ncbi:DUF6243 family protein [Streptomyces sp. AC627_RSS907]|uniref:DUF6243 family protein n=1 Tax=Streptomyces sp. AC627_RSS907 TaxID=2823684 RepID=UPI001C21A875|nr:DUF6243 family protein [Streptomyces sp. AC627_RSS907]
MSRGGAGNMLGVGGTRRTMGREALRGGGRSGQAGGGPDPQAQKRELLRKLRERQRDQPGTKADADEEEEKEE